MDLPVQWTPDGRELYVFRRGENPAKVWLVDVQTGQRRLWKEIRLSQPEARGVFRLRITRDGRAYVHNDVSYYSELNLVEGLR